jgi:hemoglobin
MSSQTSHISVLNYSANARKEALLERLGGAETLHRAVNGFYDRLVRDRELEPFFRHTNIEMLKWHQFNFMSIAFQYVPQNFNVRDLILTKHRRMFEQMQGGLTTHHLDLLLHHFESTLKELNVDETIIQDAMTMLESVRPVFEEGQQLAADKRRRSMMRTRAHAVMLTIASGAAAYLLFYKFHHQSHTRQVK